MLSPEPKRGLARERTGLAWERTAGAFAALAGVLLGVAAHRDAPGLLVLSVALVVAAAVVWRNGRRAYEDPHVMPQARALALMSGAVALSGVAAAIVVVVRI
jgi:uncharacterized membrane protein YidH (DUF202 family)